MTQASLFREQAIDDNGRPVPGAMVSFRQGSRPGPIYLDPDLRTPARNPYPAKAGGRITLYLHAGEQYEVTITSPKGQILDQFVRTFEAIAIPEQPVPEPTPEPVADPEDAKAAIMRGLGKIEETGAKLKERPEAPERQEGDMFNAADLQDLIRENEPHAEAQRRWQTDYNQLLQRLVDNRLTPLTPDDRAYYRRLQAALYMGRVGAIETL